MTTAVSSRTPGKQLGHSRTPASLWHDQKVFQTWTCTGVPKEAADLPHPRRFSCSSLGCEAQPALTLCLDLYFEQGFLILKALGLDQLPSLGPGPPLQPPVPTGGGASLFCPWSDRGKSQGCLNLLNARLCARGCPSAPSLWPVWNLVTLGTYQNEAGAKLGFA